MSGHLTDLKIYGKWQEWEADVVRFENLKIGPRRQHEATARKKLIKCSKPSKFLPVSTVDNMLTIIKQNDGFQSLCQKMIMGLGSCEQT
jgi:hypothetical protein